MPEMRVRIHEDFEAVCVVTDCHVHLSNGASIKLKPFETSAQALQRVYPDCQIFIGDLLVNAPGTREWIG